MRGARDRGWAALLIALIFTLQLNLGLTAVTGDSSASQGPIQSITNDSLISPGIEPMAAPLDSSAIAAGDTAQLAQPAPEGLTKKLIVPALLTLLTGGFIWLLFSQRGK
jgi:hypothetical protein